MVRNEVDRANYLFDIQIKNKKKPYESKMAMIDKQLYNLTINFTNRDWRAIRTDEYWKTHDRPYFEPYHKNIWILTQVKAYIEKIKALKQIKGNN